MKKLFYSILVTLTLSLQTIALAAEAPTNFTPPQVNEIEKIVHDYLINNPQVLVEVGKKLQDQEQQEKQAQIAQIKTNIPKYKKQLFNTKAPGRLVLGNPNGKIIIAEFTQHQCPVCKNTTTILGKLLKNNPEIKLIIIYWPFFGNDAAYTAKAVLAAQKQNKGEELNQLFFNQNTFITKSKADPLIQSIPGIDSKKLLADINNKEFNNSLKDNFKLAQELNLIGTPTLILANKELTKFSLVPGQTPNFESDLAKAINDVR
ncbi:MAG: thioredoxin domain-containing protein [Gammaproteobacteria bacterium]|nr:thioredoxin domain-containing protein [Gammaproteobacteria bacterium]